MSQALLMRFVSIVGASIGFYLPLSVVPLFAEQAGSESGAGLATVALLLATVACELVTPRLIVRLGYRCADDSCADASLSRALTRLHRHSSQTLPLPSAATTHGRHRDWQGGRR